MMARALTAAVAVFLFFGGWMLMQYAGRRFAARHPEFGRFREEGGECGRTCGCANWKNCAKKANHRTDRRNLTTTSPKEST